jgi:hypothetical protein
MDDLVDGFDEDSKQKYIIKLQEKLQNSIVNVKSAELSTSTEYIWTYKSTYCDVISIITTVNSFRNSSMKDVKMRNKEMRR